MYPKNLKYTQDHEWVRVEGNKAYVGITNHAQEQLGDIVFVELPEVNDSFEMGDAFGVIESVKTVSDMFMPVSGEVVEINENLDDQPELLNTDCYEGGWIIAIEMSNPQELDKLMDSEKYEKTLEEQQVK